MKTKQQIGTDAANIAGAIWDDRQKTGTLAEQLRTAAAWPNCGTDGDLSDSDRKALLALATQAEAL